MCNVLAYNDMQTALRVSVILVIIISNREDSGTPASIGWILQAQQVSATFARRKFPELASESILSRIHDAFEIVGAALQQLNFGKSSGNAGVKTTWFKFPPSRRSALNDCLYYSFPEKRKPWGI